MMPAIQSVSLVFAGGGTGGHFFPAVAIADRVRELLGDSCETKIVFVGTRRGIEYRLRESIDYPLRLVNIRGLARAFTLGNLLVPFLVIGSLWTSRGILREAKPDLVIGTGGYVSWPVLRMAAMLRIPTVIQEQNSYPGIATRQLASKAKRVYLGFDEGRQYLPHAAPIMTTGNPVRRLVAKGDRRAAREKFGLDPERRTILVLGGSQGARSVNRAVLKSLENNSMPEGFQLVWQTGKLDYDDIVAQVGARGERHHAFAFESDMAMVYAAADLVVARAGAITLAEIEAVALPSLLIPYPFAAGDHQRKNARAYADHGFAVVIDPDELAGEDLLAKAVTLFSDGNVESMWKKLKHQAVGKKPAVDIIAEDIIRMIAREREAGVDR